MAIEMRGHGRYYYRKRRIGRRVVSEYVGAGERAELMARCDDHERTERRRARAVEAQQRAELDTMDKELVELEQTIRAIMRAVLVAEGYHTHKGQWRHKRDKRSKG